MAVLSKTPDQRVLDSVADLVLALNPRPQGGGDTREYRVHLITTVRAIRSSGEGSSSVSEARFSYEAQVSAKLKGVNDVWATIADLSFNDDGTIRAALVKRDIPFGDVPKVLRGYAL